MKMRLDPSATTTADGRQWSIGTLVRDAVQEIVMLGETFTAKDLVPVLNIKPYPEARHINNALYRLEMEGVLEKIGGAGTSTIYRKVIDRMPNVQRRSVERLHKKTRLPAPPAAPKAKDGAPSDEDDSAMPPGHDVTSSPQIVLMHDGSGMGREMAEALDAFVTIVRRDALHSASKEDLIAELTRRMGE